MKKPSTNDILEMRKFLSVTSYIYYILGDSVISDAEWDYYAYALVEAQSDGDKNVGWYDELFADFDGSTGMHLPKDAEIKKLANSLLVDYS